MDSAYWGTPENMTAAKFPRPAFNISSAAGASDLAGQMAAAFAAAAVVFKKSDPAYHYTLANAADEMYLAATKNLGSFTDSFPYNCVSQFAKQYIGKKTSNNTCSTPSDFNGGSALVYYNSTSFYDDLFWAAGWMYYMTSEASDPRTSNPPSSGPSVMCLGNHACMLRSLCNCPVLVFLAASSCMRFAVY